MIVGISGKYCAGKSTVAELLEQEWNYHHIDVDRLGHRALARRKDDVVAQFGEDLLVDGAIDRRRLGSIVFSSADDLSRLEAIVHPEMITMVREEITATDTDRIAINAAILFKMGLDSLCDGVLWVEASVLRRFCRARRRDRLPILQIVKRLYTQRSMKPQSSRRDVDIHTVRNSGDREELRRQIAAALAV